jgi:chitinase
MLLTAAVGPAPGTASVAYDINTVCRDLDFVNLMTYDIHGAWDSKTGYSAPLYAGAGETNPENMVDSMTTDWLNAGCQPDKLILGVPFYGRGWTLRGSDMSIGASGNPGKPGPYVGESGMLSYAEICNRISSGWTQGYDSTVEQAYVHGDGQWFSYDNERSISAKMQYALSKNLGGAMVWALDFDDFTGQACGGETYPLLKTINRVLTGSSGGGSHRTPAPRPSVTTPAPSSTASPTYTTAEPYTRPTVTASTPGGCEPTCAVGAFGYMPDACDRNKFYLCYQGRLYKYNCGTGTYYNDSCKCCTR